ncbi:hypothetical protein BLNAU_4955 [Blattamonas nauphoetae]|uniref:Uncharacterized protein n=1 Tax=Blattamonas nauphoetae TaxID=2049346 RepID=A0ABQ9Y8H8_9EUKA|nr:hypothetical protein BLNAU_4955 [Blattamonas nauphoetae]
MADPIVDAIIEWKVQRVKMISDAVEDELNSYRVSDDERCWREYVGPSEGEREEEQPANDEFMHRRSPPLFRSSDVVPARWSALSATEVPTIPCENKEHAITSRLPHHDTFRNSPATSHVDTPIDAIPTSRPPLPTDEKSTRGPVPPRRAQSDRQSETLRIE